MNSVKAMIFYTLIYSVTLCDNKQPGLVNSLSIRKL